MPFVVYYTFLKAGFYFLDFLSQTPTKLLWIWKVALRMQYLTWNYYVTIEKEIKRDLKCDIWTKWEYCKKKNNLRSPLLLIIKTY